MIARNQAIDYHRGARKTTELEEGMLRQKPPEPEAFGVLDVIRALPDAYSETLILRLVEGLTGPEIAEQTGLTADSVRVNLHRGMKMLREKLEGRIAQ
jgi:RNA polymerase sigma-70 factor (ECF subfamily)